MSTDVDTELIGILKNISLGIDASIKGWEYVLGLTASNDGLNHIINSGKYIPFILSYVALKRADKKLIGLAYKCLINISNNETGASALLKVKKDLHKCLLQSLCDEKQSDTQAKCYILSNLTAFPETNDQVTSALVSRKDLLPKLMKVYCSNILEVRSQYDFMTLVFANISKLVAGRRLFLEDEKFITSITSILALTNISDPEVRRLGAALILRNCCLEIDNHDKLLNDFAILPNILIPLMDAKEYEEEEMDKLPIECQHMDETKERDNSPSVRKILVQVLNTLCYSEIGWNYLMSHGTYYVVRDLHAWETDENVKETIENLVTYLLVEQYSEPKEGSNYIKEDHVLIKQLESDIIKDLPDFVI